MTDYGLEVARDPTTPSETLRRFYFGSIQEAHPHIRRAVLLNPNTPGDILLSEIGKYNVSEVLFNPSLPLLLLEHFPEKIADRLVRHLLNCTTDLILAVPREAWLDLAVDWLGRVALPRRTVHTIADPRRWGRNLKTLEHSRGNYPNNVNTRALLDNSTWGHDSRAGALLVLVDWARPLRDLHTDHQAANDEQIDRLDDLLSRPRVEVHACPVTVHPHQGKMESYVRASRCMATLPGLDL